LVVIATPGALPDDGFETPQAAQFFSSFLLLTIHDGHSQLDVGGRNWAKGVVTVATDVTGGGTLPGRALDESDLFEVLKPKLLDDFNIGILLLVASGSLADDDATALVDVLVAANRTLLAMFDEVLLVIDLLAPQAVHLSAALGNQQLSHVHFNGDLLGNLGILIVVVDVPHVVGITVPLVLLPVVNNVMVLLLLPLVVSNVPLVLVVARASLRMFSIWYSGFFRASSKPPPIGFIGRSGTMGGGANEMGGADVTIETGND
jgi:hypothetical protein